MPQNQNGTIMLRVFTSRAQLPVPGAAVILTQNQRQSATQPEAGAPRHTILAVRITNENGEIAPIPIPTPRGSRKPGNQSPYALLTIWVEHPDYQLEVIRDAQVFSGVDSVQEVALIPLAEHATPRNSYHVVQVTPQAL